MILPTWIRMKRNRTAAAKLRLMPRGPNAPEPHHTCRPVQSRGSVTTNRVGRAGRELLGIGL